MNVHQKSPHTISRSDAGEHILRINGSAAISIRAGTTVEVAGVTVAFEEDMPVVLSDMVAGHDYAILFRDAVPLAIDASEGVPETAFAGFHYAPGGNATARAGGDAVPAINPFSCWDAGFRPACADPRSMVLVPIPDGRRSWVDIYKLGVDHMTQGTSRHGVTIADGRDPPGNPAGGKYDWLDFETAKAVLAHHGKQLLDYDEFRAAAFGVTEKIAADRDPNVTGLDAPRTSRYGIMQATGNLWDWGTDGDPDTPRASLFGGSWIYVGGADSRRADLGYWPDSSSGVLGARGRCDHHEA